MEENSILLAPADQKPFKYTFRKVNPSDRIIAFLIDNFWYGVFYTIFKVGLTLTIIFINYAEVISIVAAYIMFLLRDGYNGGAGFGKGYRNIMVINIDSFKECNYFQSFLRNIISQIAIISLTIQFGHAISFDILFVIISIADIWMISNSEDGRRAGDHIAHTQVIYIEDMVDFRVDFERYWSTRAMESKGTI